MKRTAAMVSPTRRRRRASVRQNSARVSKSSPRRSAILTEPCYRASFSSQRNSQNTCQWAIIPPAVISRLQSSEAPKSCLCSSTTSNCKLWQTMSRPCATLCLQTNILRRTVTLKLTLPAVKSLPAYISANCTCHSRTRSCVI